MQFTHLTKIMPTVKTYVVTPLQDEGSQHVMVSMRNKIIKYYYLELWWNIEHVQLCAILSLHWPILNGQVTESDILGGLQTVYSSRSTGNAFQFQ